MSGLTHLLQILHPWLDAPDISELAIQSPHALWVQTLGQPWRMITVPELTESWLYHVCQLIANDNHHIVNEKHPLLSGQLPGGARVQIVLPPISLYPTLCIRKHLIQSHRLDDYPTTDQTFVATNDTDSQEQTLLHLHQMKLHTDFLKQALYQRKTMIIVGGTGCGKTTLLAACLETLAPSERLIVLEDTRELPCSQPNTVRLLTGAQGQSQCSVSMQQLVQTSLRLKPDRIIIGEIRGSEIRDFLTACHTGHPGSLTTLHANDISSSLLRMRQLYKQQPTAMSDADITHEIQQCIDVIVSLTTGSNIQNIGYPLKDLDHANATFCA